MVEYRYSSNTLPRKSTLTNDQLFLFKPTTLLLKNEKKKRKAEQKEKIEEVEEEEMRGKVRE
jgi:hypothetical protein